MDLDNIELEFKPEALRLIAHQAIERKSGARGLRAVIEGLLLDTMFELPSRSDVRKCVITQETVKGQPPELVIEGNDESRQSSVG